MTNIRKYIATGILMVGAMLPAAAQRVAVKTNLLYDATTTPNLGLEVALGRKYGHENETSIMCECGK